MMRKSRGRRDYTSNTRILYVAATYSVEFIVLTFLYETIKVSDTLFVCLFQQFPTQKIDLLDYKNKTGCLCHALQTCGYAYPIDTLNNRCGMN